MDQEVKNIVKKTVKIAGVTCVALGGAALIASGAALKAMTEGVKYLKGAIKDILDEEPKAENIVEEATEAPAEEAAEAEEAPAVEETPAAEEAVAEENVEEAPAVQEDAAEQAV